MKFARLTAASAHHLLLAPSDRISSFLSRSRSACTPYLYDVPV
jgi:hypothetical protein